MSKKFFIQQKDVNATDGLRTITLVGKLEKATYKNDNGQTKKKRIFTYAYAIKHPDDINEQERGVELAKKRIESNPLGSLETKLTTCLNVDQINSILSYELDYIETNLAKFIEKI